ncbi:unnamed protein product [Trichobilharzia regenti]|nr:unnamed protein product [Trichobilharzia regenti]
MEIMFDKPFTDAIDIRGSGPCCALVLPSLLLRLPERGSKKDQPTSNQKKVNKSSGTNTTPHGKPSPPWSTKGPVRVFRPWPVNKFDQNPNDKKKNEHHNRGNQSVNQSGNLSNTPKVNPQQQQSQQQQQQQAVKVC